MQNKSFNEDGNRLSRFFAPNNLLVLVFVDYEIVWLWNSRMLMTISTFYFWDMLQCIFLKLVKTNELFYSKLTWYQYQSINWFYPSSSTTLIYNISKYMALLTCLMLQICWFDEKVAEEVWDLATCQWWLTQIIQIWWKIHQQETRLYQTDPFFIVAITNYG